MFYSLVSNLFLIPGISYVQHKKNRCLASSALSGDEQGLEICSAALRNLSTAIGPRPLGGERAAACFGVAKRLLFCCDQPQVQINCAAAIVKFVDATQVQDLQVITCATLVIAGENRLMILLNPCRRVRLAYTVS